MCVFYFFQYLFQIKPRGLNFETRVPRPGADLGFSRGDSAN